MRKIILMSLCLLMLCAAGYGIFNRRLSIAAETAKFQNFNGVVPFFTTGGFFGFFDQKDGRMYIYDEQMKKCLFQYKIEKLGDPAVDLYVSGEGTSGEDEESFGELYIIPSGEDSR